MAKLISERGYKCIRGQQRSGLEQADVIGLDYVHIECKRVENLNLDRGVLIFHVNFILSLSS